MSERDKVSHAPCHVVPAPRMRRDASCQLHACAESYRAMTRLSHPFLPLLSHPFPRSSLSSPPPLPGKYVVLFFYPLDFTFVCPTEITAFSDNIEKFRALNAEVIGVSVDSKFSHLAWINTARDQGGLGETRFPLVADLTKSIARKYNVLIEEDGLALR